MTGGAPIWHRSLCGKGRVTKQCVGYFPSKMFLHIRRKPCRDFSLTHSNHARFLPRFVFMLDHALRRSTMFMRKPRKKTARTGPRGSRSLWRRMRGAVQSIVLLVVLVWFAGWLLDRVAEPPGVDFERRSDPMPAVEEDGSIPTDSWPKEWFAPPRTASELGITNFQEAPKLQALVESGALPPVEERLPDDPIVIHPYEQVGQYGGTATVVDHWILNQPESLLRIGPESRRAFPNLAESVEVSEDGRVVTVHLRKGLKWSDGHPYTSADYKFYFDHVFGNEELTPVQPAPLNEAECVVIDEQTFQYRFKTPQPFIREHLAHVSERYVAPRHFLMEHHIKFADPDELRARARRYGYQDWIGYFWSTYGGRHAREVVGTPVIEPYRLRSITMQMDIFERNPYYPKIDPEGRQLPYIDAFEMYKDLDEEVIAARAGTGELTVEGKQLRTSDIPLFKLGETAGKHETFIWNRLHGSDVIIQANLTIPDPVLREIFRDPRFRRALSLGIDRDEINEVIYFGRATPRQATVSSSSIFFEDRFAEAYAHYDPVEAARLLDEMGLVDQTGDGRRNRPDGRPLNITLEWLSLETPKLETMELVTAHWRDIGVNISLREISASLQRTRSVGNMLEMTLWHADRTTDILFTTEPIWFVPMLRDWQVSIWPLWVEWYLSEGESGEEPEPEARQVLEWYEDFRMNMDPEHRLELGKKILASQAENLWVIGTVGLAPQPLVVSTRLRNVPTRGYWGWDNRWTTPYFTESWYLEPE